MNLKKYFVYFLIILLLVSALIAQKFLLVRKEKMPDETAEELIGPEVPMRINGWVGKNIPLEVNEKFGIFNFNSFLRVYTNPKGYAVQMLITTALRDRRDIHPPEVCYLASGFTVEKEKTVKLPVILKGGEQFDVPARKVLIARGEQKEMLLYFYTVGNKYYSNFYLHQLAIVFNKLSRSKDVPMLVRLSVPVIKGRLPEEKAFGVLEDFLRNIIIVLRTQSQE